jgi:hypothetical protein
MENPTRRSADVADGLHGIAAVDRPEARRDQRTSKVACFYHSASGSEVLRRPNQTFGVGGWIEARAHTRVASWEIREIAKTFFQKLCPNAPAWKNWDDSDSAIVF